MILVDTSVWVDHLRGANQTLAGLLEQDEVVVHPFIVGELACGELHPRTEVLMLLRDLPSPRIAEHEEVLQFGERHHLYGRGLGWVDVHLLVSALLSDTPLWTVDRALRNAAGALKLAF